MAHSESVSMAIFDEISSRMELAIASGSVTPPSQAVEVLTREELGQRLGVTREAIRQWELKGKLAERGWEVVDGTGSSPKNPKKYQRISVQGVNEHPYRKLR